MAKTPAFFTLPDMRLDVTIFLILDSGRTINLSQRYPSISLNVFEVFPPTLSHSMPPDFQTKSSTMPQVA
jgi:hypothetical protein